MQIIRFCRIFQSAPARRMVMDTKKKTMRYTRKESAKKEKKKITQLWNSRLPNRMKLDWTSFTFVFAIFFFFLASLSIR